MTNNYRFSTKAIHSGQEPEAGTGAVITPIFATSTYVQPSPGVNKGYEYSRTGNPTRKALEQCIADLENGARGFAFSSGLAASSTVLELLPHGSHILSINDLYGGSFRLFERVRKNSAGIETTYVDFRDMDAARKAIRETTRLIWVETPTNPLLKLVDLEQIASFAREFGLISVCDNTFATPYIQKPLDLGFDIVVHSATKYLNGHSDVVAGVVVVREQNEIADRLAFLHNAVGAILSPFDSFLVLRGLKTLSIRMEAHSRNALTISQFLESHPLVERVIYPGLKSHPDYNLAKKQMALPIGMITFFLKGGIEESRVFLEHCRLFSLAESLGGVESLIEHPAIMTHASIPADIRKKSGIDDNLIRVSVGIEDVDDLIGDLENAFEGVRKFSK
ncbi:MAG TPA: PLP-dependent aspartate aminotransferase family protein [Chitinispirillaceae bacterium]|jgi:cystathionine gamma-lyase|nr:PLP-dependent aspartate aminotransferase family protein [Chitinispirillaceae bacterium]